LPAEVWVADSEGVERDAFDVGDSVFIAGRGLLPGAIHELTLLGEDSPELQGQGARFLTDRHGALATTLFLAHLGLTGLAGEPNPSIGVAHQSFRDQELRLRVTAARGKRRFRREVTFAIRAAATPAIFSCDREGRLQTGLQAGQGEPAVFLRNFPKGCVRIAVVERQFGWRSGDPIEPLLQRRRAPTVVTIDHDGRPNRVVSLPRRWALGPGSYQFIARAHQPGWYLADEPYLLSTDVVSDRRFASLVIRLPFDKRFKFDNGIVLTPEIAGRLLAHRPYFRFVNNFPKGTDVHAALDPDALPAGLLSQRAAIYVISHKTSAQWGVDNTLNDVSGPGMTSAIKVVPIVPGCINWNTTLVWPNPQVPGKYDIAIDFGNNNPNPTLFAPDGTLDPPLDMIDGYVRVGFYVTEDPSLAGPFAGSIGQHDYALSSIQVPSTDTGPTPTDTLPLTATIRYPAQASGVDSACAAGAFPLVVIMHGNSGMQTSYLGYDYLLDHLAGHGFIAMSIYAPSGVGIETRARAILAHLSIMAQNNTIGLFQGHLDLGQIGIAGHSRGAEAVVRAARINTAEGLGWNIKAGISIAPTDYHHYGDPGIPLLVIYGSNDGDVSGSWPDRTCFNIYDEAGRPRSFVFVYGATHDRFNTEWASIENTTEMNWDIHFSDLPNLISLTDHENVARGYVTAFMQVHLQGRAEQVEYFSANLRPSLVGSVRIHTSYQVPATLMLDNFEQLPHDTATNSLGGGVTATALTTLAEDALRTLDSHSPHVTSGSDLAWQAANGVYLSQVPIVSKDVSGYRVLSFRVTQKYGSPQNPVNQAQDLFVRLTDTNGKSRAIRAGMFTDIPYPYVRGYSSLIKSAMKTVAIPLASFMIANLGADDVDLANLRSVAFEFDAGATGEIEIDDIEFTG
jgi:dienelactone hydrolase